MAGSRKVKVGVEIDGEKQYKQAISELNKGNQVLASEMRKLQAEYKGNAESMEFLTEKGDLLERQLAQQKDKVAELREALTHSAQQYGESAKTTQDWQIKLNDAEKAQYDLENAIKENNEALAGQGEEMVGLGDTVEELADKIGVKIPDGAKQALNGMQGFSAGTVAAMAAAAAAIAATVEVVKKLGQLTLNIAAEVDNYVTQSSITGVPVEILQAWDYAAPLIDVDAKTITDSMSKIIKAMGEARDGSGSAAEAFQTLGVSVTDANGNLRSSEEVFFAVIDALGKVSNETERTVLAQELLGKSAQELNPLIEQGSDVLQEYAQEAQAAGYVLDKYQIKKLAEADDAYQKLTLTIEASKRQIAADFAPAVKDAMELFSDAISKASEMLKRSGLIQNLSSIIQSLISIVRSIGDIVGAIPGLGTALDGLKAILGGVAQLCAVIADAADLISSLLRLDWSGVKQAVGLGYSSGNPNNWQRTYMQQSGTYDQYSEYYANKNGETVISSEYGYGIDPVTGQWGYYNKRTGNFDGRYGRNAGGTDFWRGGLTWVGEAGPELVSLPRGSQISTAQESREMAGTTIYNITIDAKNVKEFNDIVRMCKMAQALERMG